MRAVISPDYFTRLTRPDELLERGNLAGGRAVCATSAFGGHWERHSFTYLADGVTLADAFALYGWTYWGVHHEVALFTAVGAPDLGACPCGAPLSTAEGDLVQDGDGPRRGHPSGLPVCLWCAARLQRAIDGGTSVHCGPRSDGAWECVG